MRRDKTPLLLMEQLVTLLVFALAAAVCLQAFVTADGLSRRMADREQAAIHCQNVAEILRNKAGDFSAAAGILNAQYADENSLMIDYTEDWTLADNTARYILGASRRETSVPGLRKAEVWCRDEAAGDELFRIEVAWQEVTGRE